MATLHRSLTTCLYITAALLCTVISGSAADLAPVTFQPLESGTRLVLYLPEMINYSLDSLDRATLSLSVDVDDFHPDDYRVSDGYGLITSIEPTNQPSEEAKLIIKLADRHRPLEVTSGYDPPYLIIEVLADGEGDPDSGVSKPKVGPVSTGLDLKYRGYSMQIRPRMSFFLPDGSVQVSLEEILGSLKLHTETYYDVVRGDMGYLLGYRILPLPLQPGLDFFDSFEFKSIIAGETAWIRRKGARFPITQTFGRYESSYRLSVTRVSTDQPDSDISGLDNAISWQLKYDRWTERPHPTGTRYTLQLSQSFPVLGSEHKYGRVHFIGEKVFPLGSRFLLIEEFHFGHPLWRRIDLPYYAAFLLEGRDLLRGYRRTRVRSQLMTLLKSELWVPIRRFSPRQYWRLNLESIDSFALLDLGYRTNRRSQIGQLEKYKGAWGAGLQLRASIGPLEPQSLRVFFAKGLTRDRKPLFYLTVTY